VAQTAHTLVKIVLLKLLVNIIPIAVQIKPAVEDIALQKFVAQGNVPIRVLVIAVLYVPRQLYRVNI